MNKQDLGQILLPVFINRFWGNKRQMWKLRKTDGGLLLLQNECHILSLLILGTLRNNTNWTFGSCRRLLTEGILLRWLSINDPHDLHDLHNLQGYLSIGPGSGQPGDGIVCSPVRIERRDGRMSYFAASH